MRGFDMFWIIGGKPVILGLLALFSVGASEWLGHRLHHPEWHGFEPYDLIFPLFLFIAGVSTAYSIDNRLAKGESRASLHRHFIQRGLTDRKSTRLNSSHVVISYAVFCWKKKIKKNKITGQLS